MIRPSLVLKQHWLFAFWMQIPRIFDAQYSPTSWHMPEPRSMPVSMSCSSQPWSSVSIMKLIARLIAIEVGSIPAIIAWAPALAAALAVAPAL